MSLQQRHSHSLDDYFSLEEGSTVRHEYFDGEIFAMAGGTVAHNQIAANLIAALTQRLRDKPCRTLGSDMRLLTPGGLVTYPDVMVLCGQPELAQGRQDVVTNPVLLVEVLSEATRAYDLGEKFEHYKQIANLREYAVMEQKTARAQLYCRDNGWRPSVCDGFESQMPLASLNVSIRPAELYDKVFAI